MKVNNIELTEGDTIKFKSGKKYKILELYAGGFADLEDVEPFLKGSTVCLKYYSIKLKDFIKV